MPKTADNWLINQGKKSDLFSDDHFALDALYYFLVELDCLQTLRTELRATRAVHSGIRFSFLCENLICSVHNGSVYGTIRACHRLWLVSCQGI